MKKIVLALATCVALASALPSFAKGASFSSSRSFSSYRSTPSYSYRPATPAYKAPAAPAPAVVQKNVTVQQNVTHVTQTTGSSGGGFFSSLAGSFAGAGIANWLFAPKAAPAPQPVQQVDCTQPQNKALAVCQPAATK